MSNFTLNKFNFNLTIFSFFLLGQITDVKSQSGGNPQGQQTIVGSTTSTGTQLSNNYAPNLIGTHVPIAASDSSSSATPNAQDNFVADTATATYADAIAGTTASSTDDSSKSSANSVSATTTALAKVDVQDVTNWLCAAFAIVGEIPGCSKTNTTAIGAATPGTTLTAPGTTLTAPGTTLTAPGTTLTAPGTTPNTATIPGAPVLPNSRP